MELDLDCEGCQVTAEAQPHSLITFHAARHHSVRPPGPILGILPNLLDEGTEINLLAHLDTQTCHKALRSTPKWKRWVLQHP